MKIIQHCPVCSTHDESYHDWDSLQEMYDATLDEPEFSHDEGNRDCGGSLEYEEKLPDTSEAERWLDADTFIVKGKVYRVGPDCKVVEVEKASRS